MSKHKEIYALAHQLVQQAAADKQSWESFLRSAAYTYTYAYPNQLLIWAQCPQATACATMDYWNEKASRWVRRGAHGIAILDTKANYSRLQFVFDLQDTIPRTEQTANIMPWLITKENQLAVQQKLCQEAGKDALQAVLEQQTTDLLLERQEHIFTVMDQRSVGSNLEWYDSNERHEMILSLVQQSVGYMAAVRLGMDTGNLDTSSFDAVQNFDTQRAGIFLGNALRLVAKPLLNRIGTVVREIDSVAKGQDEVHNKAERRTQPNTEQEADNGIHRQRRLQDTQPDYERTTDRGNRQVRQPASGVSTGERPDNLRRADLERKIVPAPARSGKDRADPNQRDDANDAASQSRTEPENQSTGLDTAHESAETAGRGAGDATAVQPVTQQLHTYQEAESEKTPSAFLRDNIPIKSLASPNPEGQLSFLADDLEEAVQLRTVTDTTAKQHPIEDTQGLVITEKEISHALRRGSGFAGGKERITERFSQAHPEKENADWLKKEYGIGGQSWTFLSGVHGWIGYDAKGIEIQYGTSHMRHLKWSEAAMRIQLMVRMNRYLSTEPIPKQQPSEEMLSQAKALIEQFCEQEYLQSEPEAYADLHHVPIAYSAVRNEQYAIEVEADLLRPAMRYMVDGETIQEAAYRDLQELIDVELVALDYDCMIADAVEYAERAGKIPQEIEEAAQEEMPFAERVLQDAAAVSEPYHYEPINYTAPYRPEIPSGARDKYAANIAAIQLLKQIEQRMEDGGTPANAEEQKILAAYCGWGGLSDIFDPNKPSWSTEYTELKAMLTESEYNAARSSTLTAFYTPSEVVHPLYRALERMGVAGGNILDPAMGVGAFFGHKPSSFDQNGAKLYGVELDSLTGRIAKQLYQKANIQVTGYEKANLPDSFFDAAVGNVPFGDFSVSDKPYDRLNFRIHDYFLAKTVDKLRSGGIMAFITSSGTMDKKDERVRKYLSARCELIGAVRLPNTTFKQNAGTEVTSDILFFQKRDRLSEKEEPWLHLAQTEDGITVNRYFVEHPEMICGKLEMVSGPYGPTMTCQPKEGEPLERQIDTATQHLHTTLTKAELVLDEEEPSINTIPADPTVRNFSYTVKDDKLYYRENSLMKEVHPSKTAEQRIRALIELRDTVRDLLQAQLEDRPDEEIVHLQKKLDGQYEAYQQKHGRINSRGSEMAFRDDSSYFLLCSLEDMDDDGNFRGKTDLFTKRTVRAARPVDHVDTASDALALSIGEKASVDLDYMSQLTGKSKEQLCTDLTGVIFCDPGQQTYDAKPVYLAADEYLSGNVREKLSIAKRAAEKDPQFLVNVQALEQVQPRDLDASEIAVRIGATWIPTEIYKQFMDETMQAPFYVRQKVGVHYVPYTGVWNVSNKSLANGNIRASMTYGTRRANFYRIFEESLNLRAIRIFDVVEDENGNKKSVLNAKATQEAQEKQRQIEEAFRDWIFKDHTRRQQLVKLYNTKFNSIRPREYDGSHINFVGMNPEISLRPHQRNAVAHILYGGNTLLAHVVGAGKSFEMVAAAMEQKRLGLCSKTMIAVPNHLTEQLASEALLLYPNAKILVATRRDFEKSRRKRFCSKIATGDYDIIVIGHSQFEKIPLSTERQERYLQDQIDTLIQQTARLKEERAENFTVKQVERMRKQLEKRLDKLVHSVQRDDVVTFEELGVDSLMVDEAHNFKNLACVTKMRNVAGINQTESQKASDLLMKCMYLDELTGGRGVTFATGTPISNSMTEMYTMMRYLQAHALQENGIDAFDSWASTFGETVTAIELAPEGTGYRTKTRFAKFYNLPELMSLFKQCADVQTADMLKLPVPELVGGKPMDVALEPSEIQKDMVTALGERAEMVRSGVVDPSVDNMLRITNDGRKLALDQRLIDPSLPDDPNSKVNACVDRVFTIWQETAARKSTQLVFCDLSTPKPGTFNVYDDMKQKLIARGIPEQEIQFIHDANSESKKAELFGKVRSGKVRILMGSTAKMGAGTNVQRKLVALHHLDIPWRPADIEQREGRMIRQGNENKEVQVCRYVTKGTFDAYSWQLIENKQRFISQIMTSKSPARTCDDMDDSALSYAEVKALAAGNPLIKEKMDLDVQVTRLRTLKAAYVSQHYRLEDALAMGFPQQQQQLRERISNAKQDADMIRANTTLDTDGKESYSITLAGKTYTKREEAGRVLLGQLGAAMNRDKPVLLGSVKNFTLQVVYYPMAKEFHAQLVGANTYDTQLGADAVGNMTRISNLLSGIEEKIPRYQEQLKDLDQQIENARIELEKPFAQEAGLSEKSKRLAELDALLNMNQKETVLDQEPEEIMMIEPSVHRKEREVR